MSKILAFFTWFFFLLVTLAAGLFTLAGFLGRSWWAFDLASHFRVQYLLVLLTCTLVFLLGKKYPFAIFASIFAIANLAVILPFYLKTTSAHAGSQAYRVLSSNLRQANTSYDKARRMIQTADPDFLLLIEINQTWLDELKPGLEGYPYSVKSIQEDNYGIALFSRIPIEQAEIHHFGDTGRPTIVARLDTGQGELNVIGTHPPPPLDEADSEHRNRQFADLARFVSGLDGPVLLMGDLNTTSWSPYFQTLLAGTGLRDSRLGFGVQPSWPAGYPIFLVPIDHALVSSEIKVQNRKLGPEIDSDHLPIILDFSIVK